MVDFTSNYIQSNDINIPYPFHLWSKLVCWTGGFVFNWWWPVQVTILIHCKLLNKKKIFFCEFTHYILSEFPLKLIAFQTNVPSCRQVITQYNDVYTDVCGQTSQIYNSFMASSWIYFELGTISIRESCSETLCLFNNIAKHML